MLDAFTRSKYMWYPQSELGSWGELWGLGASDLGPFEVDSGSHIFSLGDEVSSSRGRQFLPNPILSTSAR